MDTAARPASRSRFSFQPVVATGDMIRDYSAVAIRNVRKRHQRGPPVERIRLLRGVTHGVDRGITRSIEGVHLNAAARTNGETSSAGEGYVRANANRNNHQLTRQVLA